MSFKNILIEKLESQQIYNGMAGKWENRFVVDGVEYALLCNSVGGNGSEDFNTWILEFENSISHRISINDSNSKIASSFAEAVNNFIKEKNPFSFFTYGSSIQPIKSILEAMKKKIKKYNLIDDTADRKDEETKEVIKGNEIGKITWTKMVPQEVVDTEDREAIVSDKFKPDYELPKDIKPNKAHMSGTSKTDKLEKGDKAYDTKTESFSEFKAKKLGVLEEGKGIDALKGAARAAFKRIQEKIKGVCGEVMGLSKDEMIQWLNDNKEDFVHAMDIARHMMDKKQLTFEEEILSGEILKENILDLVAKKSPKVLTAAALILMIMGSGQHVFAKSDTGEEAFKKAQKNAEKIVEIVKEQGAKAGEKVTQGAEKVGKEIEKGTKKVSKEIEKGAEEVGKGIEAKTKAGIEKAKEAIEKGDIETKVKSGVEKAGEVIKKGAEEVGDTAKSKADQLKQGFKKFLQKKKEAKSPEVKKPNPFDAV